MNTRLFLSVLRQYRQLTDHTRVNYSETVLSSASRHAEWLVSQVSYPDYESAYAYAITVAQREYPGLQVPEQAQ